jgi:hypothetical protein
MTGTGYRLESDKIVLFLGGGLDEPEQVRTAIPHLPRNWSAFPKYLTHLVSTYKFVVFVVKMYINMSIYIYLFVCLYIYIYIYISISLYVCLYILICIYIYIYTFAYA